MKLAILLFLVCAILRAEDCWDVSVAKVENIGMGGSLERSFELGSLPVAGGSSLNLTLTHQLRGVYGGLARSEWVVPQLCTYVARRGHSDWYWKAPGQAERIFCSNGDCRLSSVGDSADWTLWPAASGKIEISGENKVSYIYQAQALAEINHGTSQWRVTSKDAWIEKIQVVNGGSEREILRADYDDEGRLSRLEVGARVHAFEYYPQSNQLWKWCEKSGGRDTTTEFVYQNGLVQEVIGPSGVEQFSWQSISYETNPRVSNYRLPVYLASDSAMTYFFEIGYAGIVIEARRRVDSRARRVEYNPLNYRLIEWSFDGVRTDHSPNRKSGKNSR